MDPLLECYVNIWCMLFEVMSLAGVECPDVLEAFAPEIGAATKFIITHAIKSEQSGVVGVIVEFAQRVQRLPTGGSTGENDVQSVAQERRKIVHSLATSRSSDFPGDQFKTRHHVDEHFADAPCRISALETKVIIAQLIQEGVKAGTSSRELLPK